MPDSPSGEVIGLLGGTFDPVHRGHLALAEAALHSGSIGRLRWIPAGQPPHRAPPIASGLHRLAMVRLALETLPAGLRTRCDIDAAEVESPAPSYTFDSLVRLRRTLGPTQPLALILGADAFLGLPGWHRWAELTHHAHLLVTERPGYPLSAAQLPDALQSLLRQASCDDPARWAREPSGLIARFSMPATDISATAIRARLAEPPSAAADRALAALLPAELVGYIRTHRLYQSPHEPSETASPRH